ncbi:hypothetical protein V7124_18230 [Neobacillus niacini]
MEKYMANNHLRYLKGFRWFVIVLSAVLVLGGTLSVVGLLPNSIWRGLDHFLTKMTQIFGFAAVFLIIFRMIWRLMKKSKIPNVRWIFSAWQFLKKRHVLFGWIVAAAGTAHSLYFLIFIPNDMNGVYSGLVAFAVMIVMVIFGYKLNLKERTSRNVRVLHTILGIAFIFGLLFHMGNLH